MWGLLQSADLAEVHVPVVRAVGGLAPVRHARAEHVDGLGERPGVKERERVGPVVRHSVDYSGDEHLEGEGNDERLGE